MTASLPRHPNIEHLKKQAKQLLAAQRNGVAQCCQFLRRLNRFSDAPDEDILTAKVTLAETLHIVALHYGFASWPKLSAEVRSRPPEDVNALDAVVHRCKEEIPEYVGAGVPLGVVAALNHEGVDIDFMEFAAASGWAFSFGYSYDTVSPAHMGVRGKPGNDGPFEVFAFLPLLLGFDYEMAHTAEPDKVWDLVKRNVDAGKPVMSEHMDGGLIRSYRKENGKRRVFFDGTVSTGWKDVEKLQPYAVYCLVRVGDPATSITIRDGALERAVAKGKAHSWNGTPQGLAALKQYLADVKDPTRDFADTEEWFCWAAFERLMARRCCEVWLKSIADDRDDAEGAVLREAADHYGTAFEKYDEYRSEVHGGEPTPLSLYERARSPERIGVIAKLLDEGIAAESAGLDTLAQAVAAKR